MSRIVVELDAGAAAALLMAVDALSEDVADEYHRAAKRGGRAIQAALREAKRAEDDERREHEREHAKAVARLAAIAGDQPFENPKIIQPFAPTGSRPARLSCEIRVYSGARYDFGGHGCGYVATWLRPDFDEWGDIALCYRHHNDARPGQRALYDGYNRVVIDGEKVVVPTSIRHTKREWLAIRNARKVAAAT